MWLFGILCWKNEIEEETVFLVYRVTMHNLKSILKKYKMHHDDLIRSIGAQNTESADPSLLHTTRRKCVDFDKIIKIYLNCALR